MTTGAELKTFITALNADASIDDDLLDSLVSTAKAILEAERPWMVLRKTDSSLTVTTANTWQTAKSLAGITGFSRFYGDTPVILFDGSSRLDYYAQKPFADRLSYKDFGGTFIHDANAKNLYLNGNVQFSGTLWLNYIVSSTEIDLDSASAVWTEFPSRFLPVLGFYAIGVFKGAVDYDDINKLMLPSNAQVLSALKNAMVTWDNELQLSEIATNDPTGYDGPRAGAINRYNE